MITVAALKALTWKFTAHADGSDKGGRFSINFYECELPDGRKIVGSKKLWRGGAGVSNYSIDSMAFTTLAQVAEYLARPFVVGDDKEARDD